MTLSLTDAEAQEARTIIERLRVLLAARETAAPATAFPKNLLPADMADAAAALNCDVASIHAVDEVESGGSGFDEAGLVRVLYEPHVFSRMTSHRFDANYGGVSYRKWGEKPYPRGTLLERNKANWDKILYAAKLDPLAAYQSASYGRYQIMGFNYAICGFTSVDAFVAAMKSGERAQLMAFVQFVLGNHLDDELREHRWADFARRYNGPSYAENKYDSKLSAAHAQWSKA